MTREQSDIEDDKTDDVRKSRQRERRRDRKPGKNQHGHREEDTHDERGAPHRSGSRAAVVADAVERRGTIGTSTVGNRRAVRLRPW